jgi:hypothetical protein
VQVDTLDRQRARLAGLLFASGTVLVDTGGAQINVTPTQLPFCPIPQSQFFFSELWCSCRRCTSL